MNNDMSEVQITPVSALSKILAQQIVDMKPDPRTIEQWAKDLALDLCGPSAADEA